MRLLIFTQKVDKNDPVLGFFHAWLLEFAKQCQSVKVICLYKGASDLPGNVEVFSLGKESGSSRFKYLMNLYKYLGKLDGSYDRVFVHMNPIYIVLCGIYFKFKRIPIYLWYVHRQVDLKLRIAILFSNKVFTSTKESFRLKTRKVVYLGHGIDVNNFIYTPHLYTEGILRIAHIGRITPIKNLEILINTAHKLKENGLNLKVSLFGDSVTAEDERYKKNLEKIIAEKGLKSEIIFQGNVLPAELPNKLSDCHVSVNLTPLGGMDKAVLESLLLGVPTFASNMAFSEVYGGYAGLFVYKFQDPSDLARKISDFINEKRDVSNTLNLKVRQNFSLSGLVAKIVNLMN